MNSKEIGEIRRRQCSRRSNISTIYLCYVNTNKEIIEEVETSVGMLNESEQEMYFRLLKKSLSGTPGRNLLDVSFTTRQVTDGAEHRLLMTLRNSACKDEEARKQFFQAIAGSLESEDNYLILLACDTYDVPKKDIAGGDVFDASETMYRYLICSICPVKDSKAELGYVAIEHDFKCMAPSQRVSTAALGFLFPAFDDRSSNIYNALYYSRSTGEIHPELMSTLFGTDPIMAADQQEEIFQDILTDACEGACSYGMVRSVHERMRALVQQHKESKDPTPLEILPEDVGNMLQESGATAEQAATLEEKCSLQFGENKSLNPGNIVNIRKFSVEAPHIRITVEPDFSYLIRAMEIDGKKMLVIPADDGVEINGMSVTLP